MEIISKTQDADVTEILNLQYAAYQNEAVIYNDFSIQSLLLPRTDTFSILTAHGLGAIL